MAQIRVADISRWQGTIDWDTFRKNVDAVVIKVGGSDGGLYTDGMFTRNRDEARRVGLPRWYYFYKGSGTPEEQATYFINAIGGLQAGEGIVLDDENEAKVNAGFGKAFNDKVKELTKLNDVHYSNLSRFQGVDLSPLKNSNIGAWVASYGTNSGQPEPKYEPGGIDMSIIMWQYTSQARIPGVSANTVDMSLFYGDLEAFLKYGAPGAIPAPAPAPKPAPSTGNGTYTVVKNDTLSGIGGKLGIDWHIIATTNGIVAPYTIFPGQVLKVYGGTLGQQYAPSNVGGTYTVVRNDNLIGIGTKTGHDWHEIASLNGIGSPYTIFPGQVLKLPGGGVHPAAQQQANYTVTSRDYDGLAAAMSRIGRSDWQAVARLNGLSAPYTIYPNQVLRLP